MGGVKVDPKLKPLPSSPPEDPYKDCFYDPVTDEDILYSWRRSREMNHRWNFESDFSSSPMVVPSLGPLPYIELDEVQDCYNKATAIYWADYRSKREMGQETLATPGRLLNVIYPQWFLVKGHNTDIEFRNFVAKEIVLQDAEMYQQTLADVMETHRLLGKRLGDTKPVFGDLESPYMPTDADSREYMFRVDVDDHMYYRFKPLFCALLIFVDDPMSKYEDLIVKLIRTGMNDDLSAPINFDSIKLEEIKFQNEDGTVVTVGIQTAIRFVMEMDEREKQAVCDRVYEEGLMKGALDWLHDLKTRGRHRYTGKDPQGPTTTWVDGSKF